MIGSIINKSLNMRNQLLPNPPAIIQFAEASNIAEMILMAQSQKHFQTEEELIQFISHYINNNQHSDGRIYMQIDKDGNLFAHSVSPYSETFFDNIENGVKDLVTILRAKRYLTYSSCEGHGNSYRRYVGLAFADNESRDIVENYITSLRIKGVLLKKFNTVSNQNSSFSNSSSQVNYHSKINPSLLNGEDLLKHKENETKYFNISFHRKYSDYCFLEIVILEEIYPKMFWKEPFKFLWLYFMKKYKWNLITDRLTNALKDRKFPKYKY